MFALQARSKPAPSPLQALLVLSVAALLNFTDGQAHAAQLPADLGVIKVEVLNRPPSWTFTSWVTDVDGRDTNIYICYAGDLYDAKHDPRTFKINVKFSTNEGFLLFQVADEFFEPPIKTYTHKNFEVSPNGLPTIPFTLVDGTEQKSSGVVHFIPLNFKQKNMPNVDLDPDNPTDMGGPRKTRAIDPPLALSYITGEPAKPQLRSQFRGLPAAISVDWRLRVRSERATLRGILDNRDIPIGGGFVAVAGNVEWDIEAALNEYVGGNCVLYFRVDGVNGNVPFIIRGKNPLDDDARAHIDASVGASFRAYAWGMPRHESRFGPRIYNQFNTGQNNGTPYYGAPDGWGICQIDRRSNREIPGSKPVRYYPVTRPGLTNNQITTTTEVFNWHANVVSMNTKLIQKQADYNRLIGYFRQAYGTKENWKEPPVEHTVGATTLPAEAWGVMVLYNGVRGVASSTVPTRKQNFRSPWIFNPQNGSWTFDDNHHSYATGRVRPELEGTIVPTEE